jgi:ribosomal protein RSM22 (predicted rRNA methylase)
VAKSQQRSFDLLPLSPSFYALLSHTAAHKGLAFPGVEPLSEAVATLSHAYTRDRTAVTARGAERGSHLARAHFFLPRDLVKVLGPVRDLVRLGRLPLKKKLRVLDLGAGLGATSLGLSRALKLTGQKHERLEVLALESDGRALELFRSLAGGVEKLAGEFVPLTLETRSEDATRALPEGPFDVILLGFVLNELYAQENDEKQITARSDYLLRLSELLAADGVMIVLEPALKTVTRSLMMVRDRLSARAASPHVLAPCVRSGPCPMLSGERDWCHEELPFALPKLLADVARAAGLRFEGLSYAALVLGQKPRTASEREPGRVRIVSERLASKGKLELFGCGEQGLLRHALLTRDESASNADFARAERGHELVIDGSPQRLSATTKVQRL